LGAVLRLGWEIRENRNFLTICRLSPKKATRERIASLLNGVKSYFSFEWCKLSWTQWQIMAIEEVEAGGSHESRNSSTTWAM
jgi:hypothetical protein